MKPLREMVPAGFMRRIGALRSCLALWRIIGRRHGHGRSVKVMEPVDADGREIPWFTYPAIEYLGQLDLRDSSVFEYGAGNSTVYWANRSRRVVGVESNREWFDRIAARLPGNDRLAFEPDHSKYARHISDLGEMFDVIVVDGIRRRECCREALKKLRPGGLIVLDNSDWHHRCAELLRSGGLIEIDFSGMGPVNNYAWTTSLFLHREFCFRPLAARQPVHGIGSLNVFEED